MKKIKRYRIECLCKDGKVKFFCVYKVMDERIIKLIVDKQNCIHYFKEDLEMIEPLILTYMKEFNILTYNFKRI